MSEKDLRAADGPSDADASSATDAPSHPWRKRLLILVALLFFGYLFFSEILNPWAGEPYMEISHGDHIHYVPKDRDQDVSISNFPTRPPGPNETITPDGRIVPKGE
jgi:hypothetical protein